MTLVVVLFFVSNFISGLAYAGKYCSTEDVPDSQIITSVELGGCLNLPAFHTQSLNTVGKITACEQYMHKDDKMPKNRIAVHAWKENEVGTCGVNVKRADTRHLSQYQGAAWICKDWYNIDDISAFDFVVVDYSPDLDEICHGRVYLRKLGGNEDSATICSTLSNVPDGWVVTGLGANNSNYCSLSSYKHISRIPETGYILTCELPANMTGFVYQVEDLHSEQCNTGPLYKVGKAFDGALGCSVPPGMVAVSVEKSDICSNGSAYSLTYAKNGLWMCEDGYSVAPDGFIVTATGSVSNNQDKGSKCIEGLLGTGLAWLINEPEPGLIMCSGYSGVPSGFGIGEEEYNSECGGPGRELLALDSGVSICSLQELPEGLVYVESSLSGVCDGVTYSISAVDGLSNQEICFFSELAGPIPTGYVVTSRNGAAPCYGGASYTIAPVEMSTYSCDHSLIPVDWVITSVHSNSECSYLENSSNAYSYERPDGKESLVACKLSSLPSGFLIVEKISDYGPCSLMMENYSLLIERAPSSGSINVCSDPRNLQSLPEDMVVSAFITSASCLNENYGFEVSYPSVDGQTLICIHDVPPGFVVVGYEDSHEQCLSGEAYLIEIDSMLFDITTFVHPEPNVSEGDVMPVEGNCAYQPNDGSFVSLASQGQSCD